MLRKKGDVHVESMMFPDEEHGELNCFGCAHTLVGVSHSDVCVVVVATCIGICMV